MPFFGETVDGRDFVCYDSNRMIPVCLPGGLFFRHIVYYSNNTGRRAVEFKSNQTIASQIAAYVKREIFSGRYSPGQKVPPIREFAAFCCVNPNTVAKVYAQLEEEGLIRTDSTLGKFVAGDPALIAARREEYLAGRMRDFRTELEGCGVGDGEFVSLARGACEGGEEV